VQRQNIVNKFNQDVSVDCLLLTTNVGGLGLNLSTADTVIFVEHDWNPMRVLTIVQFIRKKNHTINNLCVCAAL
jgi:SNF2 family DNA or RNA helicase